MTLPRFTSFDADPVTVAKRLLGQRIVRIIDGERLSGRIVEVEAYLGADDRAAHTYGGRRTPRNESMYLPGGHAYIYFTYGMHYCMNVVCGKADEGVAVLLRAIEPEEGIETMRRNRSVPARFANGGINRRPKTEGRQPNALSPTALCSGPAKLAHALRLDRALDGADLRTSDVLFIEQLRRRRLPADRIVVTPRIGIAYAGACAERPLRFHVQNSAHVSRVKMPIRC